MTQSSVVVDDSGLDLRPVNPGPERRRRKSRSIPAPERMKVTVTLEGPSLEAVQSLADERHTSLTDVIREALATEKYLDDAHKRGERILLFDGKNTREIVFKERLR